MASLLTVPDYLIGTVRNALYAVVDDVGAELFYAGERPILERDPAQYSELFERLDKARRLLDLTGWDVGVDTTADIRVDRDEYGALLEEAAEGWLRVERDVFREIDLVDSKRARRGEAPIRDTVAARPGKPLLLALGASRPGRSVVVRVDGRRYSCRALSAPANHDLA